jgi:hypothetical protein
MEAKALIGESLSGEPGGTRTRDPLLKRQMLYRLSYRPGCYSKEGLLNHDSIQAWHNSDK